MRYKLPTLDLHGIYHVEVPELVNKFLEKNLENLPVLIITGNSDRMQKIVKDILEEIRAGGIIFNELSPEVQEELIQYSDDNKLYMGGKIDPSIFDDESYSKERITDEDGGISVEELGKKLADGGTEMVEHEGDIDRYSRQYGFDSEDLYKAFRDAGGEFEFEKELDESYASEDYESEENKRIDSIIQRVQSAPHWKTVAIIENTEPMWWEDRIIDNIKDLKNYNGVGETFDMIERVLNMSELR